jgi:hypothetical protein
VESPALLSPKEVSKILKCSLSLVYKMATRGQLRCVRWSCPGEGKKKPRSKVLFKQSDIFDFIENNYN